MMSLSLEQLCRGIGKRAQQTRRCGYYHAVETNILQAAPEAFINSSCCYWFQCQTHLAVLDSIGKKSATQGGPIKGF